MYAFTTKKTCDLYVPLVDCFPVHTIKASCLRSCKPMAITTQSSCIFSKPVGLGFKLNPG